jgi:hypothetical protein
MPLSTIFQLYRETGGPRENHRPLSHNVVHLALGRSRTHNILF